MHFHEKLEFLMNITKTTNSMLALQLSLDASYISRLRTGFRQPAKNASYLRVMASYFVKRCAEKKLTETVVAAALKSLGHQTASQNRGENPEDIIYRWLHEKETDMVKPIGEFLNQLSSVSVKKPQMSQVGDITEFHRIKENAVEIYYGPEGKREAVTEFLSMVSRQEKPCTLLLSSEENLDWLTEKFEFKARWGMLLQQVLMRGNKVKIIHHISRDIDEMLTAISEWLPIYMTGAVEPYYYPKNRDGVFQRTLFVAPGTVAVLSTSVTGKTEFTANYLVRDKRAIEAAKAEFNDYFSLCRPLLQVYDERNLDKYHTAIVEHDRREAVTYIKSDGLTPLTIPPQVYRQLCWGKSEDGLTELCDYHEQRVDHFKDMLQRTCFHEIIKLPDLQMLREGKVTLNGGMLFLKDSTYYTVDAFRAQIENMLWLLEQYENYHVYIDDNSNADNHIIYLKEDNGVLVLKMLKPAVAFAINESKMTAAFSDYFSFKLGRKLGSAENKSRTIEKLTAVLNNL